MLVTYQPEGETAQTWEFDPDKVRQSQAEMIEKRYGKEYDQWRAGLLSGSSKARRVLLWHLMFRDHPTLRYEDTPDFCMGELKVEMGVAELTALRERIERANLADDQREQAMTALDMEITEAMAREGIDEPESVGKAPSKKNESATG